MLESWANRIKNLRLFAEVVGDRHGRISRSKVDGHVQNFYAAIPNRLVKRLIVRSVVGRKYWSYDRPNDATSDRADDDYWSIAP